MAKFKPEITYMTEESYQDYNQGRRKSPYKVLQYSTYAELKKDLKAILKVALKNHASVSRSRRGQWGEWYEHWQLNFENKPVILKEGWM
jgi:hypothetical protein